MIESLKKLLVRGALAVNAFVVNLLANRNYTAMIGDGTATTIVIDRDRHGLSAQATKTVQVFDANTNARVYPDIFMNHNGAVTLEFSTAPAANSYRVVIEG